MPRKVHSGVDYDDDYDGNYDGHDDYDEYDNDYYDGVDGNGYHHGVEGNDHAHAREGNGMPSQQDDKTIKKSKLWSCSICTYDNEESSLCCDMCGVVPAFSLNLVKDVSASTGTSNTTIEETGIDKAELNLENTSSSCSLSEPDQIESCFGELPSVSASTRTSNTIIEERENLKVESNNKIPSSSCCSLPGPDLHKEVESCNDRGSVEMPQILTTKMDNVNLNSYSHNNVTSSRNDDSHVYKPEKWMLSGQEQGAFNQLNLAIVGHVDSGKSTLSGRLLHLLGRISKREMHKYEKEAKQMGKGSFAYAWAMDESNEERERGITMTVAVAYFDSKKYRVVILDSPGHKDFVSNMIAGATQADAAVLVIDATRGAFEAGMDGFGIGQTREHAQLIRSFGVEQLIVAINKMDAVNFAKERFDFIKVQLGSFLRSCGFKESSVTWIPLSAVENQNLVTKASDDRLLSWYQGLCLLDAIDSLQPPVRDFSKPFRLPICDVTKLQALGQIAASGKIETGAIKIGSKVVVMPSGEVGTVKSIECDSSTCTIARAGDNVAITLNGIDWSHVMPGDVLCHPDFPVALANFLELKIRVLDTTTPILVGSQVEFHLHHAKRAAKVVKIISLLDPKTGKVSKSSPRVLRGKQTAVIEVTLDEIVCVEEFSKCRALGRAFLRSSGNTIAVGIVNRVVT